MVGLVEVVVAVVVWMRKGNGNSGQRIWDLDRP